MKITIWQLARICHETNRLYCWSIGDPSQLPWEAAPQWQKDSTVNGIRFHLKNPMATPADSHANWLAEKLREGWKHGTMKDTFLKTHPCILPYDELSQEQQAKDSLFMGIVNALRNEVQGE